MMESNIRMSSFSSGYLSCVCVWKTERLMHKVHRKEGILSNSMTAVSGMLAFSQGPDERCFSSL